MSNQETSVEETGPRVGLFVTCLVDLFRPNVGFSAVALLENAGCAVEVPAAQTCCGQPGYNSGDFEHSRAIARDVVDQFESFDYVVAPSGSCAGMIKTHYPHLLRDDPAYAERAVALAGRSWELLSFLHDKMGVTALGSRFQHTVTYHDSCSGLRELGVREQPRALLASVAGLSLKEMADTEVCCGFGGTFCVKYPDISKRLVSDKVANILEADTDVVLGGDLGCLLNIAGRIKRLGCSTRVYHTAEVLAGRADTPAIGEPDPGKRST